MARNSEIMYNISDLLRYYNTRFLEVDIPCYGTDIHKKGTAGKKGEIQSSKRHEAYVDGHVQSEDPSFSCTDLA